MSEISRAADDLPPQITRRTPETVTVELVSKEVTAELAPGVTYEYWTYNGTVPGPFLRVREGDTVRVRLTHAAEGHDGEYSGMPFPRAIAISAFPVAHADEDEGGHGKEEREEDPHATGGDSRHAEAGHAKHSIDLHAVIGPGGGAPLMQVGTGETSIFEFVASRPGIYIYHCASPHIPTHVANGMYGMILVEPKEGLPIVDREFAVVQGELYTKGALGERGFQAFSKEKLLAERPEYVVMNGRVGALRGERALRANAGEKIRLFFGVGSHLASNVHLIGGVFDRLYAEGALLSSPQRNVQTTIVPPGGAMTAEFTIDVPGTYLLVDHSLTRAIDRGALAELVIEGEPRPDLYRAVNPDLNHTHADFAVYIEGRKLDFSDPKYMEDEGTEDDHDEHGHRHDALHMHGGVGDVIHSHKPGQTLGEFFSSLNFELGSRCLTLEDGKQVCSDESKQWQMFVNGRERPMGPEYTFGDGDQILLSFGADEAERAKELQALTDEACLFSRTCPERGDPPPENCVADPEVPCTAPLE
ncbi:MAG: multicopper oxidase domain-containing protein [Patescibacteria group bacterium]|mgnify:CR=1 FL=1